MAARVNTFKTQLTRFTLRYSPFSTINSLSNPPLDESLILNQLSDLLPIKNDKQLNQFSKKEQIGNSVRVSDEFECPEDKKFNLCSENERNESWVRVSDEFGSPEDKRLYIYSENERIGNRVRVLDEFNCPGDKKFNPFSEKTQIETWVRGSDEFECPEDKKLNLYSENEQIEPRVRDADEFLSAEDKNLYQFSENEKIKIKGTADDGFLSLEDRPHGIFIQKIRGKSEEVDVETLAKVMDKDDNNERLNKYSEKEQIETRVRAADEFLSPEDRLRGVFIQKIRGKFAFEKALSNVGVELNIETLTKVVDRGNLGGEAMVIFFNWAIKQPGIDRFDIRYYHIILKALGRRKLFEYMMGVLQDMTGNGVTPNLVTLEIVMDSFIRTNHVTKAIQIFGNLEKFGLSCDVECLNVLIGCLCKRSHVGAANSLVNKMKGEIVLNKASYDLIISGWSRVGKIGEMGTNLREMKAGGFEPDCLTFSYVIEGLGRRGEMGDAVEVFEGMREKGCVPDAGVYNAMIFNFISVGDFDKAVEYYKEMLKNDCEPNIETYTKMISGFLKARKVADAIEMFDEMLARGLVPSPGVITSFIEPLCKFGPPHAALMIYKKAMKFGIKLSLNAYKLLLMRLSRFGKCGMLLNMWDEMQNNGYYSDVEVYEYIINGLCNVGQLENAILVMEECIKKGFCPSKLICSKLNHKLMSSDKVASAYKLFLKVRNARRRENDRRICRARGWHF